MTKTYKRQFLASPTECSSEELFGSASELLRLAFSWTCSEASWTRSREMRSLFHTALRICHSCFQVACWSTAAPVWAGRAPSWPYTNYGWTTMYELCNTCHIRETIVTYTILAKITIIRTLEWPACPCCPRWWPWGDSAASWSRGPRSTDMSYSASGQIVQGLRECWTHSLSCSFMVSVEEGNYYETVWRCQDGVVLEPFCFVGLMYVIPLITYE